MASEGGALFLQLAILGKRKHLKAPAIGENGLIPCVEFVQSSGTFNNVHTRTQIEMVGIAQYNLGFHIGAQFVHVHSLHGTHSAYRHKNRRFNIAVVGGYHTGTSFCIFVGGNQLVFHNPANFNLQNYNIISNRAKYVEGK